MVIVEYTFKSNVIFYKRNAAKTSGPLCLSECRLCICNEWEVTALLCNSLFDSVTSNEIKGQIRNESVQIFLAYFRSNIKQHTQEK